MMLTKEQQIEKACTEFCNRIASATLDMVKTNEDLSMESRKAFATGMMCAIDQIKDMLLPTQQAIVKENPRYFENLN